MFCFDLSGRPLWRRDLGPVSTRRSFGEGGSPVVHAGRVIVNRDHEGQSSIIVLDARTGETVWQAERDEPSAWATPLVVESGGRARVITNATNRVRSYDLADGSLIWECGGQVGNVIPSPVTDGERVYCMSGYRGSALHALPLDAKGDITGSEAVVWSKNRGTPYVPSPLLYDGLLYFNQSNDAILSCLDAKTGETVIERTRMPGVRNVYASPVGAAGRVYFFGRDGGALVIRHGREFEVLAENRLDEGADASPAVVGDQILLRGPQHLYCIAEDE
jgi:outer membrane protein assembly factor BamB